MIGETENTNNLGKLSPLELMELKELQERQNSRLSNQWDLEVDGKRLLELRKRLNPPPQVLPLPTASEKKALHRQGWAGTNGIASLSKEESDILKKANAKAQGQKLKPR